MHDNDQSFDIGMQWFEAGLCVELLVCAARLSGDFLLSKCMQLLQARSWDEAEPLWVTTGRCSV